MKRTFRALTTIVSVVIDDDLPVAELARMMIRDYPDAAEPAELEYHLRGGGHPGLACAGRLDFAVDEIDDLVPLFELDLYRQVVERAATGWLLHAAALELDGGALVLAGPSGAGKTTLTLALAARGARVMTEEIVQIDRSLVVQGLARPFHVPANPDAIPASWSRLAYPMRGPLGRREHTIAQPPAAERTTGALPLRALVRIDHGPERPARLEVPPPHRALTRLWDCTLRRDAEGLAAATAIIAAVRPLELVSSSVAEAVALAESIGTQGKEIT